jgi:hypothetical protein
MEKHLAASATAAARRGERIAEVGAIRRHNTV